MIPFGYFQFFIPILFLAIPAIILGLTGRSSKWYNLICSLIMLQIIFSELKFLRNLIYFVIWQWIYIKTYSFIRSKKDNYLVYLIALLGSLFPLLIAKHLTNITNYGFLGISYVTFRCLQMIIEIKDGLIKKPKFIEYLSFLLFFPTISSGPIDRFRRFIKDLNNEPSKEEYRNSLYLGIRKIFQGFLYKYIIAFLIKIYWLDPITLQAKTFLTTLNYMYAYSFHLFFDFAGYSAFAIGVSYIFWIKTPENFNKPFISSNIREFWNRWHMSLSFWFRDYIYMRIVCFFSKRKILKNKLVIASIGYYMLFGLMGLWHGIQGNYILYGIYHATLMTGYSLFELLNKKIKIWGSGIYWNILSILITFHTICFGFLIFSGRLFIK